MVLAAASFVTIGGAQADDGMLGWRDEEIVQALDAFIPRLMEEDNVPGAQVAFVRDGQLLYERAFGVRNVWSRVPVTTETLFEAASLSKPVAAMAALQLTAEGRLPLDRDIGLGIEPAWLEPGPDGAVPEITLRQVLTHTSGLSNDIKRNTHELAYPPGARFAYSGEGFGYLGYVLTAYEQAPFADVVRQRVLEPLGMAVTDFEIDTGRMARMATGHTPLWTPVGVFLGPFVVVFLAGVIIAGVMVRLLLQQPRLEPPHLILPAVAAVAAGLIAALELVGFGLLITVLLYSFVYVLCIALAYVLWRLLFHVLGFTRTPDGVVVRRGESSLRSWQRMAMIGALAATLPLLFLNVPLPLRAAGDVHPASSLRGTAGEIALFAQEMVSPRLLPPRLAREMRTPQVAVGNGAGAELSWGLGIGIRDRTFTDGERQRSLWQWGSNPGYASLLVAVPSEDAALVILTNSQGGGAMVQTLAAHVFGGLERVDAGGGWRLPLPAIAPQF